MHTTSLSPSSPTDPPIHLEALHSGLSVEGDGTPTATGNHWLSHHLLLLLLLLLLLDSKLTERFPEETQVPALTGRNEKEADSF